MAKVVVVGGGWAGCSAAISASKAGADVVILEKTDLLVGLGNVGGIMRNNGRFTACEEAMCLGARELFQLTDEYATHRNINFPGHNHATLYNVLKIEPQVRKLIKEMGIEVRIMSRVVDVDCEDNILKAVILEDGEKIEGDSFIDTTGSAGPMGNCSKYGNCCAMCVLRCPSFGGRVSITARCGVEDMIGERASGDFGAFSGSMKLLKISLSEDIQKDLNEKGFAIIPLPENLRNEKKLDIKVCQQYALHEFAENIILLDTGHAKLMTPYFNLEKLRSVSGFETACIADPYSGGKGNSIRYMAVSPRDNYMRAENMENLFVAGEKSGFYVGHTEAICTGALAGHNAVRYIANMPYLELPESLLIGDFLSYSNYEMHQKDGSKKRFTFAGSIYFNRMKEIGFYTTDKEKIEKRVKDVDLIDVYNKNLLC